MCVETSFVSDGECEIAEGRELDIGRPQICGWQGRQRRGAGDSVGRVLARPVPAISKGQRRLTDRLARRSDLI